MYSAAYFISLLSNFYMLLPIIFAYSLAPEPITLFVPSIHIPHRRTSRDDLVQTYEERILKIERGLEAQLLRIKNSLKVS